MSTYRQLSAELKRSPELLVPPAFQYLWTVTRFLIAFGGRASAKSWSIARILIVLAHESPLRILCTREIQGSIKESAYRLLCDQIELLGLSAEFDIQADSIIHKNGSRFFFEGLRYNSSKIRSYESIDICWVEEAQSVSELSWETLLPTIRKPGSRFFISFNPLSVDDPVLKRFVLATPPGCIARKVSYLDNPFFSPESEQERAWLEQTDPDSYRHVWLGETRTISDAQIFKNKFTVDSFDIDPAWAGPYHGVDFGFSKDPSAGVRCHIDDVNRVLYISKEFWKLGCDIDALANELESAIPGISKHTVYCDSSRPETISYMSRSGIPNARAADKWPGSVDDGVMYLRSFAKIVIDPSCTHVIDECRSYSFKTDRLTGAILPEPEDKNNHLVDALRYAMWPLIKNVQPGGFFSRAALLVGGEPVEIATEGRPQQVFGVVSTTTRPGSAAGLAMFLYSPHHGWPLTVLEHDLAEVETALDEKWLEQVFARLRQLSEEYRALSQPAMWVESDVFGEAVQALAINHAAQHHWQGPLLNVCGVEADVLALTVDERASAIRTAINSGKFVKISRPAYSQQSTFRSTTTNFFTSQIFGYRPEARDQAQELVNALCVAIALCTQR